MDGFTHTVYQYPEKPDTKHLHHYHISIKAGLDGFSFIVFHPEDKRYQYLAAYQVQDISKEEKIWPLIEDKLFESGLNKDIFQSVSFIWNEQGFTLLPGIVATEKEKSALYSFNQITKEREKIFSNHLSFQDITLLFPVPNAVIKEVKKCFPDARFFSGLTPLIEGLMYQSSELLKDNPLIAFVENKFFKLIHLKNASLEYAQSFPYQNETDFTYYLNFAVKQLGFENENIPVLMLGMIEKEGAIFKTSYKYIRHLSIPEFSTPYRFSRIDSISQHQYFDLFHSILCE